MGTNLTLTLSAVSIRSLNIWNVYGAGRPVDEGMGGREKNKNSGQRCKLPHLVAVEYGYEEGGRRPPPSLGRGR